MTTFKVAHVHQQGNDLIIIPLDSDFGHKPKTAQNEAAGELQLRSNAAGLKGTAVPVWDAGGGRMAFIAPNNWHPFFKSVDLAWVWANVNREIHW